MDHPITDKLTLQTRRHFFKQSGLGLGAAALSSLISREAMAAGEIPPAFRRIAPKAKRAIYLFMSGAPAQHDMFDYKPAMGEWFDKDLPESIRMGQRLTTMTSGQKRFPIAPTKFAFEKVDNNADGAWMSELLPFTKKMAKDLCIIKSMHTEAINHDPAITYICTGSQLPGRASLGAWLSYGLGSINAKAYDTFGDPEIQARIAQYEMAFRMQTSVPDLTDLSSESDATFEMYGPDSRKPGTFAYCALLARRLAERGVRFTQIFHRGWDQHGNLGGDLPLQCRDVDQASYALIQDLKRRGLLDDTLVIWGGEFGRTAYCQGKLTRENYGRDHHPKCFSIWMAGAGVKPGIVYGETDEFSYNITENPVHIHELNATLLHLLGLDHQRLSVKVQGLDMRLTGVEPVEPVKGILV